MTSGRPFGDYRQKGKTLQAGLNWLRDKLKERACELSVSTWENSRLPEFLWLTLLLFHNRASPPHDALRKLAQQWPPLTGGSIDARLSLISHSYIAALPDDLARSLIAEIIVVAGGASALRPLALLDSLPAIKIWRELLARPQDSDWEVLGNALLHAASFHSDFATDICWFLDVVAVQIGATEEPAGLKPACDEKRTGYPANRKEEGGFFRTLELQERMHHPSGWATAFWDLVFKRFPFQGDEQPIEEHRELPYIVDHIMPSVFAALHKHFVDTRTSTLDPVHDAAFGIAFHSCALAAECVRLRCHDRVFGLVALRSICEATINLGYLINKSNPDTWQKFRDYGYGKARLLLEKISAEAPIPAEKDWLATFAGEEKSKHLVDIELGDWSGQNLRGRAMDAGLKHVYDAYYDFTSSVSHAEYLGINLIAYTWDLNPFHRRMHVPRIAPVTLPSVLPSLIRLLNLQLEFIDSIFPRLQFRIPLATSDARAESRVKAGRQREAGGKSGRKGVGGTTGVARRAGGRVHGRAKKGGKRIN
jgi:hypothetical protein